MQQVERKKHGKRRGRLAAVALCALLLAGGITAGLLLRRSAEEEPPKARERITGAITKRSAEDLRQVTITQRGQKPWSLLQDDGGKLTLRRDADSEETFAVDESAAAMILDAAANLTYEDVFTEDRAEWEPEAEEFGLKEPLVTAEILFADGQAVTARIGDSADPDDDAYYYLTVDGDDRLYAVAAGTVEDLRSEKELLHPVEQIQILSALLDRITVRNGDGTVRTQWELQGQVSDRDAAENWKVTVPFTYPADYDMIKNLRDAAEDLRLGIYIGKADEGGLAAYGLGEPAAELEFHMAAGSTGTVSDSGVYDVSDWEERTVTLTLGGPKTGMVDYVLSGGEIYTINHFTVGMFTETDPLSTAARYPVATPLNSLESLTVEKQGGEAVHYALIRQSTDEDDASGEASNRCMRNGEEISWDTFEAAYERLLTVTVSGKLDSAFRPGEPHTRYTFRTVSGGTHTVELSDYDGLHDAVTMDGETLFYLIRGGMPELP